MRSDEREIKDVPQIEARAGYIIPAKASGGGLSAAMMAVTIACAIGAGALLTTGGQGGLGLANLSETFDQAMRFAGWRSPDPVETEQASALIDIQRDIGSVATNIDALSTRLDMSSRSTDQELARLKSELSTLKSALEKPARDPAPETVAAAPELSAVIEPPAAREAEAPDANLPAIRNSIAALKNELEQPGALHSSDIDALMKRLDRLELAVNASIEATGSIQSTPSATQDVTGSIPAGAAAAAPAAVPPVKHTVRRSFPLMPGWSAAEAGDDILVTGPSGVYRVDTGAYVPGLGRIEAVRDNGRLVVLGGKLRRFLDYDAKVVQKRN